MAISVLPKRDELGVKRGQLYIDGTWCDASDGGKWTHVNPAANEEIAMTGPSITPLDRSHSHELSRAGRPNCSKKPLASVNPTSGSCAAR